MASNESFQCEKNNLISQNFWFFHLQSLKHPARMFPDNQDTLYLRPSRSYKILSNQILVCKPQMQDCL